MCLDELVMQAKALLSKLPHGTERAQDLEDCLQELRNGTSRVLVVGQDKVGKSALVNVLSRKIVARMGVTPVTIDGGIACYPWGRDLLCDTMGYLADRKTAMPRQIAQEVGRASLVVFLIHPEGLCPTDRQLLEHIRRLGVPLLIGINRMDETDDEPSTRRDIENEVRSQIPWLAETEILLLSLRDAIDALEAAGSKQDIELPRPVIALEAKIRSMLEKAKRHPDAPLLRRTREHLEWLVKELRAGDGSILMSRLKRLQEEVKGKEQWLKARVDLHVAEQMEVFDKLEEALIAAIDAGDSDRVNSVREGFEKYSNGVWNSFSLSLSTDLESARRDLIRAIREAAEDLEKTSPTTNVQNEKVETDSLAQAAKAAAEHVAEAFQATDEALQSLARLSRAIGWRLATGSLAFGGIEFVEEAAKSRLAEVAKSGSSALQKAAEGYVSAGGGFSVEDVGNAFQTVAVLITSIVFIHGLLQRRKKVEAAKKDVAAKLTLTRKELRSELEAKGFQLVLSTLAPFDRTLDNIARRVKDEIQKADENLKAAQRLLSAVARVYEG